MGSATHGDGRWRPRIDRDARRGLVIDANEGIVALAGIVEGVLGAGGGTRAALVAMTAATVAGSISIGGAAYAEAAAERDTDAELLAREQQQLGRSPAEELAELADAYEAKGLTPHLAREVAAELTTHDALAAHADVELGIDLGEVPVHPLVQAVLTGLAFAAGAAIVGLAVVLTPSDWRVPSTFLAVAFSLSVTSVVLARWSDVGLVRTLLRTVGVGVAAMVISFAIGSQFDL